jgi:hypothetical protein
MDHHILDLWDQIYRLRGLVRKLELSWSGPSADDMIYQLNASIRTLTGQIEQLDQLRANLLHQANRWDEIDQVWTRSYQEMA